MLLALMYHRVGMGKHANSLEMMRDHLRFIKENYPVVLPGDPLHRGCISVVLTFDDAYFDFYHYVFPLLKELNLRALLGVPVSYILESTTLPLEVRLSISYLQATQEDVYKTDAPFCTWEELRTMVESGHVEVASHSYSHPNLTFPFVDFEKEIVHSKEIMEKKLPQTVSSFIYPFGKTNAKTQAIVAAHYPYSFRIGSALNRSWGNASSPLFRVPADHLPSAAFPFKSNNLVKYFFKSLFSI